MFKTVLKSSLSIAGTVADLKGEDTCQEDDGELGKGLELSHKRSLGPNPYPAS